MKESAQAGFFFWEIFRIKNPPRGGDEQGSVFEK